MKQPGEPRRNIVGLTLAVNLPPVPTSSIHPALGPKYRPTAMKQPGEPRRNIVGLTLAVNLPLWPGAVNLPPRAWCWSRSPRE